MRLLERAMRISFKSMDEVPTHAITIGIASILKSEQIILLASGKSKANAVKTLLESKEM